MKTQFALMLVVAVAVALAGVAYAADTATPAPAAPATAAPAAPAAKPAHEGVEATVKGTVAGKTVTRKGKEVKMYEVTVAEAKGADGKAIDGLKGQVLRLGPKDKAAEIAAFDGKTAEITGKIVEGKKPGTKMMRVETIK